MSDPSLPADYPVLLRQIVQRIRHVRTRALLAVNHELVLLYWQIGNDLCARRRHDSAWGAGVTTQLAADLTRDFPDMTGWSPRNL